MANDKITKNEAILAILAMNQYAWWLALFFFLGPLPASTSKFP